MVSDGLPISHLPRVYGALAMLCVALVAVVGHDLLLRDPDTWWHIKSGEWMVRNGRFPTTDPFSHSFAGQAWIAKEWLSQVMFFAAFSALGWTGVSLLVAVALALSTGALYRALAEDLAPAYALLGAAGGLLLASPTFTARPFLLSLPVAILWTHELFKAARAGRAPHPALLVLIVLWANLHAAFTIGLLIAGAAFVEAAITQRPRRAEVLYGWGLFLVLCPIASCIHPYGWKALLATWWLAGGNEAIPLITEWQPFNAQDMVAQEVALLVLLGASVIAGFRLSVARALLLVLLLHMALTHVRFICFLFPLLPVLAAPDMASQFPRCSAAHWRAQPRDRLERGIARFQWPLLAAIAGVFVLACGVQARLWSSVPPAERTMAGVLRTVNTLGITGHVFNAYDFGGPLIFHGIPTFIDGRSDQLFIHGFTTTFMSGPGTVAELAAAFRRYDITWSLLPPADHRNALIAQLPGWQRAYADGEVVIYRRAPLAP